MTLPLRLIAAERYLRGVALYALTANLRDEATKHADTCRDAGVRSEALQDMAEEFRAYGRAECSPVSRAQWEKWADALDADSGAGNDVRMQFLEANMTRLITYSEPELNGDWHRLEFWNRKDTGKRHDFVTGPDLITTIDRAMNK